MKNTNSKVIITPSRLDEKVITLKRLDEQIAILKEEQDIIKDELKSLMDINGVEELIGVNEKVTYKESISYLFNDKLLIKDMGMDFYEKYKNKERLNKPFKYKF